MAGMSNPTHDPGANLLEPDATTGELPLHPAHPAAEAVDVLFSNQSAGREDPIAKEADTLFAREHHALVPMDLEPQGLQKMLDLPFDLVEPPLVVGEDQEVIDVADVTQPEMVGDEVIEGVEIDVGEKLAGLIAQRQTPTPLDGVNRSSPGNHISTGSCVLLWSMIVATSHRTCGSLILRATSPLRMVRSIEESTCEHPP